MDENDVIEKVRELGKILPKFPDGRINYRDAEYAPVVDIFIAYHGELLMFKRSDKVGNYRGMWNTVSGYLDRIEQPRERALGELREETGIPVEEISLVIQGEPYELRDDVLHKTWLICPFLVELKRRLDVKLNFEHTECEWIKSDALHELNLVPGVERAYEMLLGKMNGRQDHD